LLNIYFGNSVAKPKVESKETMTTFIHIES